MSNEDLLDVYPAARVALIEARQALGLKQYEAAAKLNISWRYYRMVELGEATPYPRLAERITKLTGYEWEEERCHT